MNAYCAYDDDSTFYDLAEAAGGRSAATCGDYDTGHVDSDEDFEYFALGIGPDLDESELETQEFAKNSQGWDFEDCDAVEQHALRQATVATTLDAMADRVADAGANGDDAEVSGSDAVALLTWAAAHLENTTRRRLAEIVSQDSENDATAALALWRGGALQREELKRLAHELLDSARVALALEDRDDSKVIEGPWRRGIPPLERTHHLHVLLLAIRHAELRLDGVDEQVAELWQEELRTELSARQREIRSGTLDPSSGETHFVESAHLVAAVSEMWRDTAPAARPVRLPLEKLTRLLWQATRTRKVRRAERAALLIAAGNQRLDDLPLKFLEAGLYDATDSEADPGRAARMLSATWVGGRRPDFGCEPAHLDLATESLVVRALSGPARTGPRRG